MVLAAVMKQYFCFSGINITVHGMKDLCCRAIDMVPW